MKWISQDIEQYLKAIEYIDTAVIPLIPISFGTEIKQSASMSEILTLVSTLIEKQFTGRILLLPPFTYLTSEDPEKRFLQLEEWLGALKKQKFKYLFLITCDSEWKMKEDQLKESLIWFPTLPLENLENSQKFSIVESQVQQLSVILTRKWQESV